MNAVMYIIADKDLKMSPGKLAAQCAHAAVQAYLFSAPDLIEEWLRGGHYCKIVLRANSNLHAIDEYLLNRNIACELIIDEGRTELDAFTPTAIGCAIVDKDDPHIAAVFSSFKLY